MGKGMRVYKLDKGNGNEKKGKERINKIKKEIERSEINEKRQERIIN